MTNTDGIDNVVIYWDDDDGEYNAGQLLTGRIEVLVDKTTSFKGIRLKLSGTMRIKWIEMEGGSTIPYEEFENIIYENLEIFTPNLRDKDTRWIFPGKHVYKFQYQLPKDLPYSLDGSRYGRIEYKSKAEVLIPMTNPVESLEEEFIIHSRDSKDIEARQAALEAKLPKENVEYGELGGGCFVKRSHVEMFIKLSKSVYKQGQYIRPVIECTVEKGKCEVDAVMVVLVQEMIYTCNLDEVDECRRKEVLVVCEDRNEEDADPGEKEIYSDMKLKIDKNMPPTGFPHCDHIECGYFVHAVAKTNRLYDDIVVKLPIVIQHGDPEDWDASEEPKEETEEMKDGKTGDTDNVLIVGEEVPIEADNVDEDVDELTTAIEETDVEEQNLPGQIEDMENQEIIAKKDEDIEDNVNEDETDTVEDTKELVDNDDGDDDME